MGPMSYPGPIDLSGDRKPGPGSTDSSSNHAWGGRMGDWLLNLPVLWMGAVILATTYLGTAGIYLLVTRLGVGERGRSFTSISAGILSPLAIVFALLVGFLAAQVWNESDRAN